MNIIIFLIILLVLVISHEFGHFIVAKKAGIRVDEFAFGFPPKLFGIKKGETSYNFNLIPFGGFVKIFGENPDEESLHGPDSARSFVNKPARVQALVLIAGVVMNFLLAWLLISISYMSGMPASATSAPQGYKIENAELTITSVQEGSPAELSGLRPGDRIMSLYTKTTNTEVPSLASLQTFVRRHVNEEVTVSVNRSGDVKDIIVVPKEDLVNGEPGIGISMDLIGKLKLPVHKALWEGLVSSVDIFVATVKGFYNLIHDAIAGKPSLSTITGPVGIVGVVGDVLEFGFVYLLSFTALISINLAVINLIPFPALDGGRLLFLLIEKIKGSRIKPQVANMVNMIGFGILMLLMVIVTYRDIANLF